MLTRHNLQDSSTGVLYGTTSESFVSSSFGNSYPSGWGFGLGGTGATFVVTFQLPATPPRGYLTVFVVSLAPPYNSSDPATKTSYNIYVTAVSATLGVPPATSGYTGYSNISGYLSAGMTAAVVDAVANTTTSVSFNRTGSSLQFVPKLFGGSWVTVAVSVSSTGNVLAYTRDSVLSSNSTFGAPSAACAPG